MNTIHPVFDKLLSRSEKETQLNQKGRCYWLFGPSGSGKTTIAIELEKKMTAAGRYVMVIDGDNLRSGLNQGLGFSNEDRLENIRRSAELIKILVQNGVVVIACFVCPMQIMRDRARQIIGSDYVEVYIQTSIETLIQRDTKGFYKKALAGEMDNLSGMSAEFEEPTNADIVIETDQINVEQGAQMIINYEISRPIQP